MMTTLNDGPFGLGKGRLAAVGRLALVALPLLMAAGSTPHPSGAEAMAPVPSQGRDAAMARMDPPWTWAERYYFTS
ncbi:hypothetical protein EAH89_02125 [Roseomonas nepalensis]|uniref:Uncharacterized protein n=1 Tax=Muricoccus nepalensis TaxID=1854500 RepID=A0A502GJ88_9PROT|nr:hypothetical protein [Roseomonas nepalensis]TPG61370.1 hypothetical protein EAH89_02125 [Roseomonas nepalensis]